MKALLISAACVLLMASCTPQDEAAVSEPQSIERPGVFNGTEGGPMDLAVAQSWEQNWQKAHPNQPKGLFYGKETINAMLNQQGAVGIRFYPGYDEEGKLHLMMYSTDKNGNDILTEPIQVSQIATPCPPFCGGGGGGGGQ